MTENNKNSEEQLKGAKCIQPPCAITRTEETRKGYLEEVTKIVKETL